MFAHQFTRLQFQKDVHFGDEIDINISREGDVLKNNVYLRVQWPTISTGVDDSFGTRMIDFIELLYNTQLLERHYGETMQILNDLTVPLAKQTALNQLLGTGNTFNLQEYYVRIPLSVNLPLCALNQDPVIRIKFRKLSEISNSTYTGTINVDLFVDYVYLTDPEKKHFKTNFFDYNAKTYQRLQFNIDPGATNEVVQTNFIGSVSELYWVIQTDGASDYDMSNQGSEQLVSLQLSFNNIDVIPQDLGTPIFLRYTQALTYHTASPSHYFYMYSFSLDPENPQPYGEVDFNYILNQVHNLTLSSCPFSRQLRIYAKTNNIFRVGNGDLKVVSNTIKEAGTTNIISKYYKKQYPGLYYFNTFEFTTLGTFGSVGPTTPNSPNVTISSGIQNWKVPTTGIYSITAAGARGTVPGRVLQASNVPLAQGQILSILIGQLSSNIVDFTVPGGGGGTYIVSGNIPLLVAAGGDSGVGAVSSQGFITPGSGNGNDGAGFYGNGTNLYSNSTYLVPKAYVNGGAGNRTVTGTKDQAGGFGGGQAPKNSGISGGGGYTGGPGATSYTSIQNTHDMGSVSNSAGYVNISLVNPVPKNYTWDKTWSLVNQTQNPSNILWNSVTYAQGIFVAVGNGATMYSVDGININVQQISGTWLGVAFGNGTFVAVGQNTQMFSTDGNKWTLSPTQISGTWNSVVFGNGIFVSVGTGAITSTNNGLSWTVTNNSAAFNPFATLRVDATVSGTVTVNSISLDLNENICIVGDSTTNDITFFDRDGTTSQNPGSKFWAKCSYVAFYDNNFLIGTHASSIEPTYASTVSLNSIITDANLSNFFSGNYTGTVVFRGGTIGILDPTIHKVLSNSGSFIASFNNLSFSYDWIVRIGGSSINNLVSYRYYPNTLIYACGTFSGTASFCNSSGDTTVTGVNGITSSTTSSSTVVTVTAYTGTFQPGMVVPLTSIGGSVNPVGNVNSLGTISSTNFTQASFTVTFSANQNISQLNFTGAIFTMPGSASSTTLTDFSTKPGFVTVYNSSGVQQWKVKISGNILNNFIAVSAASGSNLGTSNCIVTGTFSSATVSFYAPDGIFTLFSLNNSITSSIFTTMYSTSGTAQWSRLITGTSGTVTAVGASYVLNDEGCIVIGTFTCPQLNVLNSDGSIFQNLFITSGTSSFIVIYNSVGTPYKVLQITNGTATSVSTDIGTSYFTVCGTFTSGLSFGNGIGLSGSGGFTCMYDYSGVIIQLNKIGDISSDIPKQVNNFTGSNGRNKYVCGNYVSAPFNIYNDVGTVFKTLSMTGTGGGYFTRYTYGQNYLSVAFGIGYFVAVSYIKNILISTDGTIWSSLGISDQSFQSIAFGNGKFTIVGSSVILTSNTPNQSYWPQSTIPYRNNQNYIIGFGNNQFVVFGSYSGEFFSTDGITWSAGYFPNIYTYSTSVAYGNNRFMLVGQNVSVPFYLSYQNINKFIIPYYTFNTPEYFFPYVYKVIWVPQLSSFVATVSQKGFMISSDGKIWNYVDGNANGRRFNSISWSPELGVCVALGSNGGGLYSNNLNTWTTVTCPVTNDYYGWCSITWSLLLGIFVAVGCVINAGDQPVTYSQDGIVWNTPAVSAPISTWKSVTWSPVLKIFVAVAGSSITTNTITRGSFATMSSSDGKNWTVSNSLAGVVIWNDVTWSTELGLFVAVGENAIMYSSDGAIWNNISITGMIFNSVTWSTELSLFVAGGGNTQSYNRWRNAQASKPVYTSSDGKSWAPSSYSTQLGTSIAWSPELGLFAGSYGTINHAFAYSNSFISF